MSIPKGDEVQTQAQSAGGAPSAVPVPCPSGDVPKEGSRDIQQKGKIIAVPHDWCKSTDSPVPYKIWAWQSSSSNLANTVRQTDCGSHVLGSTVNQCFGDEPGTGGGVKSGTHLAECTPLSASPTVRAENRPMVRYLDKWWMNHGNTWGCLNNPEDMGKYNAPKVQNIDQRMVAFQQTPGTETDAPTPGTTPQQAPQEIPQEEPADARDSIARKVITRTGIAVGATVSALAAAILVASTTSTAKDDVVRVTRSKPNQTCDDERLDELEKEKKSLMENIFTNLAFKSGNEKKLVKVSCDDLLKRIDGLKKCAIKDSKYKMSASKAIQSLATRMR